MRKSQGGLSLIEVLVVLVLVSMIAVLMMQGVGQLLASYSVVQRVQHASSQTMLRQQWFRDVVSGVVASRSSKRAFTGSADAFSGYSLTPLVRADGIAAPFSLSLVEVDGLVQLQYEEGGEAEELSMPWSILELDVLGQRFAYRNTAGQWLTDWPDESSPREKIPRQIALLGSEGELLLSASLSLSYQSVTDFQND